MPGPPRRYRRRRRQFYAMRALFLRSRSWRRGDAPGAAMPGAGFRRRQPPMRGRYFSAKASQLLLQPGYICSLADFRARWRIGRGAGAYMGNLVAYFLVAARVLSGEAQA